MFPKALLCSGLVRTHCFHQTGVHGFSYKHCLHSPVQDSVPPYEEHCFHSADDSRRTGGSDSVSPYEKHCFIWRTGQCFSLRYEKRWRLVTSYKTLFSFVVQSNIAFSLGTRKTLLGGLGQCFSLRKTMLFRRPVRVSVSTKHYFHSAVQDWYSVFLLQTLLSRPNIMVLNLNIIW